MAWVLCLPLSPGNCVTMAVTRGCWHLPLSDLDDIPTSQSFCEKSEGIIYANLLTHVKPSLNGCYYFFFYLQDLYIRKEIVWMHFSKIVFQMPFWRSSSILCCGVSCPHRPIPHSSGSLGPCSSSLAYCYWCCGDAGKKISISPSI